MPRFPLTLVGLAVLTALAWLPTTRWMQDRGWIRTVQNSRQALLGRIAERRPHVAVIGNSMVDEGVDVEALSTYLELRTTTLVSGGGHSAWNYLVLKNVVVEAKPRVPVAVVAFRDNYLTLPAVNVSGEYRPVIRSVSAAQEPLLRQLAYVDEMDPAVYFLGAYWPLYADRDRYREKTVSSIKRAVGRALGRGDAADVDAAVRRVFDEERLDPALVSRLQLETENKALGDRYDFDAAVERSFLPAMITIARDHGIRLVFVRTKRRRDVEPGRQPEALVRYVERLKRYMEAAGATFIDFTDDRRIREEHFGSGDHLNRGAGRALFTRLLADTMRAQLKDDFQRLLAQAGTR